MKVTEAIKKIYPTIQGGFVYWETKKDGSQWQNPIDGLVWENTEFTKPTWEQIQTQLNIVELEQVKNLKTAQLKKNRDLSLEEPLVSVKAFEMDAERSAVLENEVYFSFSTKSTGNGLTEPSSIVFRALMGSNITYSCEIIEETKRKGYVRIDQSVAQKISSHLQIRATETIHEANRIESEIEACETLEELENININFN